MTRPPQIVCRCEARKFPHREDAFCRIWADENEHERRMQERDRELDSPTRGQADAINRENRNGR